MHKILKIVFPFLFLFILIQPAIAQDKIDIYFFYGNGCPHCADEEKFLAKLQKDNKNIEIHDYEVWNNRENANLMAEVDKKMNLSLSGVPLAIIGDIAIKGYYNEAVTGKKIKDAIEYNTLNGCEDTVASILGTDNIIEQCTHHCDIGDNECRHDCGCSTDKQKVSSTLENINIPIFGEVDIKNISLPALTFLVAALDGFNPCAMWVLLFLISLLLGMEDRKKMWILGSAFIFSSGLVYFLFLSAWLNLFLFLGFVIWLRLIVGSVALGSGWYHLKTYWSNRDGSCQVINEDKRRKVFGRLKEIISNKNFLLSLVGIMLLAAVVNLVELVCSAGLPAVYTQVLTLANLPTWQYYAYLVFYIFIFTLDDLLIFVIAMTTLRLKGISSKYTRWSSLVGGILMLIIGVLLIFKPGWLMF